MASRTVKGEVCVGPEGELVCKVGRCVGIHFAVVGCESVQSSENRGGVINVVAVALVVSTTGGCWVIRAGNVVNPVGETVQIVKEVVLGRHDDVSGVLAMAMEAVTVRWARSKAAKSDSDGMSALSNARIGRWVSSTKRAFARCSRRSSDAGKGDTRLRWERDSDDVCFQSNLRPVEVI